MIVSSRIVKPHMVKKWARPGTVHCRSLRWPATSTASASALGTMLPRVRFGSFFPERMSLDSQWKRYAAIPKPTSVRPIPRMILTGTNAPRLRLLRGYFEQGRRRSASATWDFNAAPEDSGVAPGGPSSGGPTTGTSAVATPEDARAGPPRSLAVELVPEGLNGDPPPTSHLPSNTVQQDLACHFRATLRELRGSTWRFSATGNPRLPSV